MRSRLIRIQRRSGFTLLELGIVLGVAAILAAAIAPDFIEAMRTKMAEKAAVDVAMLHDAARWYFIKQGRNTGIYKWPGEQSFSSCQSNFTSDNAKANLLLEGFLPSGGPGNPGSISGQHLLNPWDQAYDFDAWPLAGTSPQPECMFGVETSVPQSVAKAFIAFLPTAGCNMDGETPCRGTAAPPAGMVRCCSYVPRPGYEAWNTLCGGAMPAPDTDGILRCP